MTFLKYLPPLLGALALVAILLLGQPLLAIALALATYASEMVARRQRA